LPDIAWLTPASAPMSDHDWAAGFNKSVTVFLNGSAITEPNDRGERITGDSLLLLLNGHEGRLDFTLPGEDYGKEWAVVLDTAAPDLTGRPTLTAGGKMSRVDRSLMVLRRC
jgi:glycogen operon protein